MKLTANLCRNESEVKSKFVAGYLLPKLGYTPAHWHQEVTFGQHRLDFLVFTRPLPPRLSTTKSPVGLIVEAKHPQEHLDNHVSQIERYLHKANIQYGILTNGKELRIYQYALGKLDLVFHCPSDRIEVRLAEAIAIIGRDLLDRKFQAQRAALQTASLHTQASPNYSATMKTIAVYHNKGGVGKTTVSTNLAAAFSQQGYRVLLIDIDAQANSTFATGLVKFQFDDDDNLHDRNVYNLIASADTGCIPEIVRQSEYFSDPEIAVIPAHINLIGKQTELTTIVASRSRLLNKLKQVEDSYDLVIIDTPPSRDIYAEVALLAADYLLIPSDLKPFANQGLPTVKDFIKSIDENRQTFGRKPLSILGVLASKISTNAKYIEHTLPKQREVIERRYQMPLMSSVIYDRTALSESFNKTVYVGELEYPDPKSIFKYAREVKSNADLSAQEFTVLADEILEKMELK